MALRHLWLPPGRMKLHLQVAMLACCALAGCHAAPPVTRDALVGSYAYQSQDPEGKPTDHEFDHLTLQADGKYDLVQCGSTKAKSEKTGIWQFYGGDPAQVDLDHSGYPVQIKGDAVRLLIDNDVGIWFAKTK